MRTYVKILLGAFAVLVNITTPLIANACPGPIFQCGPPLPSTGGSDDPPSPPDPILIETDDLLINADDSEQMLKIQKLLESPYWIKR
jgi:hypothetical protein